MAGQSNMQGDGMIEGSKPGTLRTIVTDSRTKNDFAEAIDGNGNWVVRDDVIVSTTDQGGRVGSLTAGFGNSRSRVGMELGFGIRLADWLGERVLLIKANWGGQSLGNEFRPPSAVSKRGNPNNADLVRLDDGRQAGLRFKNILDTVRDVIGRLPNIVPNYNKAAGYEIVAFEWHQGWNDACNFDKMNLNDPQNMAKEYELNLADFIVDMRKALASEFDTTSNLPFIIGASGFAGSPGNPKNVGKFGDFVERGLRLIWSSYMAVGDESKHPEVGAVHAVDSVPFAKTEEESPGRAGYHWWNNAETYYRLGRAMAETTFAALRGNNALIPTPRPTPAPTPIPGGRFDESACVANCRRSGYCCNDPSISGNQLLSCSQACKIRASGVAKASCRDSCNQPPSCTRRVGAQIFNLCGSCSDINHKCLHGVMGVDACHTGCDYQ